MFNKLTSIMGILIICTFLVGGCSQSDSFSQTSKDMPVVINNTESKVKKEAVSGVARPSADKIIEVPTEVTKKLVDIKSVTSEKTEQNQESTILMADELFNDFYIGESLKSGYVYIEPFKIQRTSYYEGVKIKDYPNQLKFYTIEKNNVYYLTFDSVSKVYIPSVEEDSKYYWQGGLVEPEQSTLRYTYTTPRNDALVGITLFKHEVLDINYTDRGKPRIYSKSEYSKALEEVKQCNTDRDSMDGTLREKTIEDTIVGAKQICTIGIKNSNLKIKISKYLSIGIESTADVYVMDVINETGQIIKTYEKYNYSAY